MRALALRGIPSRRFRRSNAKKLDGRIAKNVLDRKFQVAKPNRVWASDITYLWTQQGWRYLAVTIDLYSRRVVGWELRREATTDLVIESLRRALAHRDVQQGLIHHSDQGCQLANSSWISLQNTAFNQA